MGTQLSPSDEELYRRADEVLHYIWDPIGISSAPGARDEYHAYLAQVFSLLKSNADAERIASYLTEITTDRMGLNGNHDHALHVANVLLRWKETIVEKFA